MKKYHVSENGPKLCKATKKPCPISAEGEHFSTMKDAEEHYATQMARNGMGETLSVSKPKTRKNAKAEEPSYFTNDNTEMREKYGVPKYFKFNKAFIYQPTYQSNAAAPKGELHSFNSSDFTVEQSYTKDLDEIEAMIEEDPFEDYLYQSLNKKYMGLEFVKEAMNNDTTVDLSFAKELNQKLTGEGPSRISNAGEIREDDKIYIELDDKNIFIPKASKALSEHTEALINNFIKDLNKDNAINTVSEFVIDFVASQPFNDGNKRTASYIASVALAKNNLKPLILNNKGQNDFAKSLDDTLMNNNIDEFKKVVHIALTSGEYDFNNESMKEHSDKYAY